MNIDEIENAENLHSEEILAFAQIREELKAHCSSRISKEMASELSMMDDEKTIADSLAEVEEALMSFHTEVEQPLGGTRDIRKALAKSLKGIILTQEELWDIYTTITAYKRTKHFFDEKYLNYPLLSLWTQDMPTHEPLERKFNSIFDKKGFIKDCASPKLSQLRQKILTTKDKLKRALQEILHNKDNQKYFQEAIVTQRNERYVIPVKQEYRYAFQGIIHDKSATGSTLYIEPMIMVKLNNDLQEAMMEEEREIMRIYKELSNRVKMVADSLQDACKRISYIEFVYGKASYGLSYKGVIAEISKNRYVNLVKARHPLLPVKKVVPTTIVLGDEYDILLITGSNTGGKTVALKTLGLLCMMHQSGLCIPAEKISQLPTFSHIYADIGDEQSIEESLSTFSGHMTQIKKIMDQVGPNDLVLIDELGSGTDPEEGSALAVAIMDYFRKLGPLMMVTTHYNDLKNYAYNTPRIENGHVEFNEKTLKPTYKLRMGVAGSSHAVSIAKRLGLPNEVIEMAKNHKSESKNSDMEEVLSQLHKQLHYAEVKEERLQKELNQARKLRDKAQRELKQVESKKKDIIEKAKSDAHNLKRNLKLESAQIIKELKAQFSEKNTQKRQEAMQAARQAAENMHIPEIKDRRRKIRIENLELGQEIFVNSLNSVGIVKAIEGKQVVVDVNGFTVRVKQNNIGQVTREETNAAKQQRRAEEKAQRRSTKKSAVMRQANVSTEINVIGQTVDEAIVNVSRFIDQAVLAGLSSVRIVHGKGTGALRAGLHDFLHTLPVVKKYQTAGYDEGGAGATNVEIK